MIESMFMWVLTNKEWLLSGVGVTLVGWLLSTITAKRRERKQTIQLEVDSETRAMKEVDQSLLKQFANIFSGDTMYGFFENLELRIIHYKHIGKFEGAVERYLSSDKTFRNSDLEIAKRNYLMALHKFTYFTSIKFFPINDGLHYKFYGGISALEIMTTYHNQYQSDEEEYLKLTRLLKENWDELLGTVREVYPEFEWSQ